MHKYSSPHSTAPCSTVHHAAANRCGAAGCLAKVQWEVLNRNTKRTLITEMIVLRQLKIWDSRSVGNISKNVYAMFRCTALHTNKGLEIFTEHITRTMGTRTTRVAFWDSNFGLKNDNNFNNNNFLTLIKLWLCAAVIQKKNKLTIFSCTNTHQRNPVGYITG